MNTPRQHLYLIGLSGELDQRHGHPPAFRRAAGRQPAGGAARRRGLRCRLERRWSRLLLEADAPEAAQVARRVFGVAWVARAVLRPYAGSRGPAGARRRDLRAAGRRAQLRGAGDPRRRRRRGAVPHPGARAAARRAARCRRRARWTCAIRNSRRGSSCTTNTPTFSPNGWPAKAACRWAPKARRWRWCRAASTRWWPPGCCCGAGSKLDYFLASLGGREHRGAGAGDPAAARARLGAPAAGRGFVVADFRPLVAELELDDAGAAPPGAAQAADGAGGGRRWPAAASCRHSRPASRSARSARRPWSTSRWSRRRQRSPAAAAAGRRRARTRSSPWRRRSAASKRARGCPSTAFSG